MPDFVSALILGLVEGLTEFLPVSSTGHLIVVGHLLGYEGDQAATFDVVVQLGAIAAVAAVYRARLARLAVPSAGRGLTGRNGWLLLGLTTLPALVVGAIAHDAIQTRLFAPTTVAIGLVVGGCALLVVERITPRPTVGDLDALCPRRAALIGVCQCLALWPGMSRSAATVAGGMLLGIERRTAAEYSFLAALPVLAAAAAFQLYDNLHLLEPADLRIFGAGFVAAFLAAWLAVRAFVRLLSVVTLRPFGWYRIVAGLALLAVLAAW